MKAQHKRDEQPAGVKPCQRYSGDISSSPQREGQAALYSVSQMEGSDRQVHRPTYIMVQSLGLQAELRGGGVSQL